jgi:tRNA (guanine-N7-)-methyltransferase
MNAVGVSVAQARSGPSLIYRPASWLERLALEQLFPSPQPLEVELGSGDGSFFIHWAKQHPDHNFLGIERLLGRLRKLDRKAQRAGLANTRLLRIEASYFLEYLLPAASCSILHVYFPDPWPKRKHRKNRLVNERFTDLTARVLASEGIVYLRTDDADYFSQMSSVFNGNARFRAVETPEDLGGVATDFERGFQSQGVATLRAAYQLL